MNLTGENSSGGRRIRSLMDAGVLLLGGFAGAAVLTMLQVPAGALIGAVAGSSAAKQVAACMSSRRQGRRSRIDGSQTPRTGQPRVLRLPDWMRLAGQILLGVMAGTRLNEETLHMLAAAAIPIGAAVVVMLGVSLLLARYLFQFHGIDPLTAAMAAAPGGISELAVTAQRWGAAMHVVLTVHLFRILVVVLLVLPLLLLILDPQ